MKSFGSTHVNNSYASMAYKVVVCKKQNGPCNEKTTRFLDCNFNQTIFLRLLGTFAVYIYVLSTIYTVFIFYAPRDCHKRNFVVYTMTIKYLNLNLRDSQKASPHESLPPPAGPQFQTQ